MKEKEILETIDSIVHPETGTGLVASGMVQELGFSDTKIRLTLASKRPRDPFAPAVVREVVQRLAERFSIAPSNISVTVAEANPKAKPQPEQKPPSHPAAKVLAVVSGKGGVGKSTVTANLALTLAEQGYRVGVLDADIYGPSQPLLFGVENFHPEIENTDGQELFTPAVALCGVKIMSIGFFIDPADALVWRGPMATSALRQLIHQTKWGQLDYLFIDMPPGTGDVHLTVLQNMQVDGALIVSTPQKIALADVVRGIAMLRAEKLNIEVIGIVENMAWFTPREFPDKKYYIFGRGGTAELARRQGLEVMGQIPLVLAEGAEIDGGLLRDVDNPELKEAYKSITQKIISI